MSKLSRGERGFLIALICLCCMGIAGFSIYNAAEKHANQVKREEREAALRSAQEILQPNETAVVDGDDSEYLSLIGTMRVTVPSFDVFMCPQDLFDELADRGLDLAAYGALDDISLDDEDRYVLIDLKIDNDDGEDVDAAKTGTYRAQRFYLYFDSEIVYDSGRSELLCGVYPGCSERDAEYAYYWDVFPLLKGEATDLSLIYAIPAYCGEIDWDSLALGIGNSPDQDREKARWLFDLGSN